MLGLVALAELLAMTLWFSATAVTDHLIAEFRLTGAEAAWLTMAVQAGFVAGTLGSAVSNLPDVLSARRVFGLGCLSGAAANYALTFAGHPLALIALRFVTGIALAGVYPPGMKIIAGWFVERRGTALGVLIGALTVGSATPHLLAWLATGMDWRMLVVAASALALAGGALVWVTVRDGPYVAVTAPFDIHAVAAGLELVHLGGEKWTTGWVARCAYEGVGGASGEPDRLAR